MLFVLFLINEYEIKSILINDYTVRLGKLLDTPPCVLLITLRYMK
jgi:hypothetical protein